MNENKDNFVNCLIGKMKEKKVKNVDNIYLIKKKV